MAQLLLELFSEEIPARMQGGAARDLERMAAERLKAAGLTWEALTTFAGPRRLTLVVEGLPAATPDREEELKGPRANAPEQALDGFLRKTGLTKDRLIERDGVFFAVTSGRGQATTDLIPGMVDQIIRGFPWPKSMRWGDGTLRWVRPLKRILCLFDGKVVPFTVADGSPDLGGRVQGIETGDATEGHRFMGTGRPLKIRDFADYRRQLEANHVILDVADRKLRILEGARKVCADKGLALVDDDGLLDEVAGLAEWPTPILGDMDPAFLSLPPEVVRLSMKVHQKYFAVRQTPPAGGSAAEGGEGGFSTPQLAPHFVVVANVEATDGGKALAAGNSRVLSARLDDARFFWDEDLKTGFEVWSRKLEGVIFHAKLGTLAERVERIAALAREIAPLVGADPDQAEAAARLAKADLASAMVGEFPELQGVMGGYYARAFGHPDAVADAVRDHYKPQGPADSVPTAPLTVAVALADKLDTLVGFFAIDEKPTGSKDPQALRRAALGAIRLVLAVRRPFALRDLLGRTILGLRRQTLHSAYNRLHDWASPYIADYDDGQRAIFRLLTPPRETHIVETNGPVVDCWNYAAGADFVHLKIHAIYAGLIELDSGGLIGELYDDVPGDADAAAVIPGLSQPFSDLVADLLAFFADRLKVLLRDQGKRHDLVDAVFALGDDDLVRIVRRVEALEGFLGTESGANLLAAHKRAVSILKAEEKKGPLPTGPAIEPHHTQIEEGMLFAALQMADQRLEAALAAEEFEEAMLALANLRGPVYAFFDNVFVNEPEHRDNRLKLLGQVRAVMGRVADFGMVGG